MIKYVFDIYKDKVNTLSHKLTLTFMLCILVMQTSNAQLVITEIMLGNVNSFYEDEVNPDSWVEIYNPTDSIVFIHDHSLGHSPNYDEAFGFHHIWYIFPLCYLAVTCDDDLGDVWTNLDDDGGNLYLFDGNGNIIDSLSYPKIKKPDVSWGLDTDGNKWGYMLRSTPSKPNTTIADKFPSKVEFSVEGGVWEKFERFHVELTAKDVPDYFSENLDVDTSLCIRYTLDGSEPTDSSPIYTKPILIDSTTFIRAKVFDSTKPLLVSNAVSYIYHGRPVDKNVVSIITDSFYFFDEEKGILGNRILAQNSHRRPMNFEYFPLDSKHKSLNFGCKGRAGGNSGRANDAYLNLVLNAKKRYGEKHFKTEFWPHLKPLVKETKSTYLRSGNKNACYMRDAVNLNMASYFDIDYQATDALSVYLNGKYYGFLYMYERSNEDYVWSNYNKLENVDFISIEGSQKAEVKNGTIDEFNKFRDFWQSSPHSLYEWRQWMDVDGYTSLIAMEMFGANRDFWYNNTRLFKSREDSTSVWKWVANDFDNTFTTFFDKSYFKWALEDEVDGIHKAEDYGSQLWKSLLECEEYKNLFLDRVIAYHGDFLNKRLYNACVDSIYNLAADEITLTRALYSGGGTGDWHCKYLKECIEKRSDYFHTDLQSFFQLNSAVVVKVDRVEEDDIDLYYNNVKLKTHSFDGWDFVGRKITLQTKNTIYNNPERFDWVVKISKGKTVEIQSFNDMEMLSYVIPSEVDTIVFTPIKAMKDVAPSEDNFTSIIDLELLKKGDSIIVWDLYGRQLYRGDLNQNLVLPKKVPLIISVDGQLRKVMF